jgi:hypothetical protein
MSLSFFLHNPPPAVFTIVLSRSPPCWPGWADHVLETSRGLACSVSYIRCKLASRPGIKTCSWASCQPLNNPFFPSHPWSSSTYLSRVTRWAKVFYTNSDFLFLARQSTTRQVTKITVLVNVPFGKNSPKCSPIRLFGKINSQFLPW